MGYYRNRSCGRNAFASIAVVTGLFLAALTSPSSALTITDDMGGNLRDRADQVAYLSETEEAVAISGYCASSCLMFLSLENVCVQRDATFLLHGIIMLDDQRDSFIERAIAENYYMRHLPSNVRTFWRDMARTMTGTDYVHMPAAGAVSLGWVTFCGD